MLGGCLCILFGHVGQLPPVMDLPLYTTITRNDMSDLGSTAYHCFNNAVVLDQIMHQQDDNYCSKISFFTSGMVRQPFLIGWEKLMRCTPSQVGDMSSFHCALHLLPTVNAVTEYNLTKLRELNRPIAVIKLSIVVPMLIKHLQMTQDV